jgi:hypothetical protein
LYGNGTLVIEKFKREDAAMYSMPDEKQPRRGNVTLANTVIFVEVKE